MIKVPLEFFIFLFLLAPALIWWSVSFLSVLSFLKQRPLAQPKKSLEPLSLFKPLPPFKNEEQLTRIVNCLESFIDQLLPQDEILFYCQIEEQGYWLEKAKIWEERVKGLRCKVIVSYPRNQKNFANLKVSALSELAPHATQALWWWSDADITAPEGTVSRLREEFSEMSATLLTAPYVLPCVEKSSDWLDAFFIHAELLPGITYLAKKKQIKFACGASLLFYKQDFLEKISWEKLGAALADDHFLGQHLGSVQLSNCLMQTEPSEVTMPASWAHYLRWQKTVRWCQPAGFAGLLILQPFWLTVLAWGLGCPFIYVFGFMILLFFLEALWVSLVFKKLKITTTSSVFWVAPLWSITRSVTWLLCWLPLPVYWCGKKWCKPFVKSIPC